MITKINLDDKTIKSYAIRKLTPRECYRLMGVREDTIDRMQQKQVVTRKDGTTKEDYVVSASQQYKQAGNSIVVDCMLHLFENLFYSDNTRLIEGQASIFDFL